MTEVKQPAQFPLISETLNSAAFSNRWREDFLKIVMRVALVLGAVLLIYNFRGEFRILATYAGLFVLLAVITFAPISYSIRAGALSLLLYILSATVLLGWGMSADATMFFLAFITLTVLLFDYKVGLGALALTIVTMFVIGWLVISSHTKLLVAPGTTGTASDWLGFGLDMVIPAAVIILAVYFLKREFNTVLRQFREIFQALRAEQAQLEQRVEARTSELMSANQKTAKQASRLRTVAEVSRLAVTISEQERLMKSLTNLISQQLGYYHIGIFLLDDRKEYAILAAANSEGGRRMLENGHRLQVGQQGIVGYVTSSGNPRIALDVGADAVFFNNPQLPQTHSEMCLPLKVNEILIGALDIQSKEANAFAEEDFSVFSILADQVAVAIQNAKSAEQTKRALKEAEIASSQLTGQTWKEYSGERQVKGYSFRGLKAEPLHDQKAKVEAKGLVDVPIRLRGQVIGSLKLNRMSENRPWSENDLAMAQATADRVALAIENARLLEDAQRQALKEQQIADITSKISQSINLRNVLQTAAEELGRVIPGSDVIIQFQSDSEATQPKSNSL